jgi:hypothetical protein
MDDDARGLVEGNEGLVLVENVKWPRFWRKVGCLLGQGQGDLFSGGHNIVGVDSYAVDIKFCQQFDPLDGTGGYTHPIPEDGEKLFTIVFRLD